MCKRKTEKKRGVGRSVDCDERIAALCLFAGMKRAAVGEIVRCVGGEVRRFAKGEVIVHEGTRAKWLVPVLSGVVSVFEPGASGERHLVRTVEAGQLFGATLVTTRMEYYPGMAVAADDCEVAFFCMESIRGLWRDGGRAPSCARFFENLYTTVSEYVLYCWRKMSIMSCSKTEDRLMLYLNWYASETGKRDFKVPFARVEDLARYLGVTRVSLSRAIGRLVGSGEIMHSGKGRFVLKGSCSAG